MQLSSHCCRKEGLPAVPRTLEDVQIFVVRKKTADSKRVPFRQEYMRADLLVNCVTLIFCFAIMELCSLDLDLLGSSQENTTRNFVPILSVCSLYL